MKARPRQTRVKIAFEGTDITDDIKKYLLSMRYTDEEEDAADDLQIVLQDKDGIWMERWLNQAVDAAAADTGLAITASIIRENWNGDGREELCECGAFTLDSVTCAGPPATVTLRATSLSFASRIRQTKKSKSWENYNLSGIANEMARGAGMSVSFLAAADPYYKRIEQYRESDIAFLRRLCHETGLSMKTYRDSLVVFGQAEYEAKAPAVTIRRRTKHSTRDGSTDYTAWSLDVGTADTQYQSCRVSYNDPATGRAIEGTATVPDYDSESDSNQQLEKTAVVRSVGEAQALAAKLLRLHNKYARTAEFEMPGNPNVAAGMTVALDGWGSWNGTYIIAQAEHAVGASGYTTSVRMRKTLEGY